MTTPRKPVIEVVTASIATPEKAAQKPRSLRPSFDGMLPTIHDVDSSKTLTPTTSNLEKRESSEACASSPFYCHPTTRYSFEVQKSETKPMVGSSTEELDIECGHTKSSGDHWHGSRKDCTVWPGKQTLMAQRRQLKNKSSCNPMRNLTKKQKLWTKIIIALLIVGTAVGIGIGVSKAVGGGVWKNNNEQRPIGDGH